MQLAHENLAKAEVWVDRLATDLTAAKAQVSAAKEAEAAAVAAGSERSAELQRRNQQLRKRLSALEQASGRGALDLVDSVQAREAELAAALAEVDRLRTQLRSGGGVDGGAASPLPPVAESPARGGAASRRAAAPATGDSDGGVESDDSDSSLELYVSTGAEKPRLVASTLRPRAAVKAIMAAKHVSSFGGGGGGHGGGGGGGFGGGSSVSSRGRSASKQVRDAMREAAIRDRRLSDSDDDVAPVVSDGAAAEPPVRVWRQRISVARVAW